MPRKCEKSLLFQTSRLGGSEAASSQRSQERPCRWQGQPAKERVESFGDGEGVGDAGGGDRPGGPCPQCPARGAPRKKGETRVRGVRGSGKPARPGAASPRVRNRAGRWAEGGGARPRGSAEMRGRGAGHSRGTGRRDSQWTPGAAGSGQSRRVGGPTSLWAGPGRIPGLLTQGWEVVEGRRAGVPARLQGECGPGEDRGPVA